MNVENKGKSVTASHITPAVLVDGDMDALGNPVSGQANLRHMTGSDAQSMAP